MHYHPMTAKDRDEILEKIGVSSFEELLEGIPKSLRNPQMSLSSQLSEIELQKWMKEVGSMNQTVQTRLSFLGGGSYEHFIPAAVSQIVNRSEFYTAYTPYQAEASQGMLQAIFEYQSLVTELTGLDVSNASHYDGATSLAEAAILALRHTDRQKVLVSRTVHPFYRDVLKTYLQGMPCNIIEIPMTENGLIDSAALDHLISDDVACAIFQSPNFWGVVENFEGVADKLHQTGALMIQTGNPLSLAVFKSPGEWGADIAAGEGQPLGIPLYYGGPYLGYFAVARALMRKIPGRLAGMTQDADGRRAFCLTIQAREQHIRRERASSNICTNQTLCALMACVHMTLLGKEGIKQLAEINMDRAYYLREKISKLRSFSVDTDTPIFNEFVVKSHKPFKKISEKLVQKGIFPGIDLETYYPEKKNEFLVCATETKTRADLDRFVEELSRC